MGSDGETTELLKHNAAQQIIYTINFINLTTIRYPISMPRGSSSAVPEVFVDQGDDRCTMGIYQHFNRISLSFYPTDCPR